MKRISLLLVWTTLLVVGTITMNAQSDSKEIDKIDVKNLEEEQGSAIFKFEPNYLMTLEKRRNKMAQNRRIIDTLDISENKRRKLLRDLYKNEASKRFSKFLVTDTKFENIEE